MTDQDQPVLVLTNDDGIDAPGMQALLQAAGGLGRCRVIAPCGPLSGCGHQVTTHQPIRITPDGQGHLAVAGTPADCIRLAIFSLATEVRWVLSGINSGGNLGTDVYSSGTVAAVREAAIRGVPGIAVSHYIARGRAIDWPRAAVRTGRVLRMLMAEPWEAGTFWNVNLPHPAPGSAEPEIILCPLDASPLPLNYRIEGGMATYTGDYQGRTRRPGADVAVCFGGQIAVTQIRLLDPPGESVPGASWNFRANEARKPDP
ncbi:MAG TPA: 5'/3'-nucleotidase SurE [Isosphaeraceae bacterium]|nr:5'/3'-nucleotidase SurE [Isosphaeraceae bacterium]